MSHTERVLSIKKYSNRAVFDKRAKDFKLKSLYDLKIKNKKKFKYGWLKKLIKGDANFSFPILSTSTTYILSDKKKQLNIRNKLLKNGLYNKNKYFNSFSSIRHKNKNTSIKENSTFLTESKQFKPSRIMTAYKKTNRNNKLRKNLLIDSKNQKNTSNYRDNTSFNYFLFNNFSSCPNADILLHFESEKNLSNNFFSYKKVNNNNKKNHISLNRIKSEDNYKKIIEYKNKKINIGRETVNQSINKSYKYKRIQYSSNIKKEKCLRVKENYWNKIEATIDSIKSLELRKKFLNMKFIDKMVSYIRFIYSKIEKEKNINTILINKIIAYKNEIKQLNNKIRKKIIEKNNILKWIYFQIQLKEKRIILPSYYRTILENRDIKKKKKDGIIEVHHCLSEQNIQNKKKNYKKMNANDFDNYNGLFYNCEINLDDPKNKNEINKIQKYKTNLIFKSVDEFYQIFNHFESNNISMMKYYYKLKMKIFYLKKENLDSKSIITRNQDMFNNILTSKQNEFNDLNNYIKYKNKVIQQLNLNKYNINLFPNSINKNKDHYILFEKINKLYNTCKLLKINFNFSKEKNPGKNTPNYYLNKITFKLKYITFVLDYLLAKFKIYKNPNDGKSELLNKLKNEIEKNNKIRKAYEQRVKDKENIIKLKNKIEERNNKIYFLPYKKVEIYSKNKSQKDKSNKKNKVKNIQFNDLFNY